MMKNGHRLREIGFRYATAASPQPIMPSLDPRLFV
jgi:hypothetical protein